MAPKTAQKRELSAAELAMLDDIGAGRIDELPLEDTGRVPRNDAAMNSIESGRTGTDNRWNQAIAGGAFDDDDAAVVAGQRELANGQLAQRNSFEESEARHELAWLTRETALSSSAEQCATLGLHLSLRLCQIPARSALPVSFASPAFLDRIAEYPGTIYLVAGPATNEDQIILHIDEDRVGDVKRRTNEYVDYLSDADRLILQFKDNAGCITWFVVIFRQRDVMVAFVAALRNFVDRLKEPSPSPAATDMGSVLVDTSDVPVDPPRNTSASIIESSVLSNETAYDLTASGKSLAETTSRNTVARHLDTIRTISVAILEDIVSWAMHIVAFVRDSGPAELANADALPGIIRGAAAAVLMEKHAGFADLDSKQRVAYVDEVAAPQVFDRFKRRMLEDAAKKGPTKIEPTILPSIQKSPDVQETTPPKRLRPKYTIQKLLQLESTAVDPPEFLTELRYLPEMNPENRALIEQIIRQAHGLPGASLPLQTPQVSERATPRTFHMDSPRAGSKLDGHVSPARAQNVDTRNSDAVSVHAAPALPTHPPRVTVTAPVETPHPDEPLVSIHGEMNGLNSSRHNKNGVDLLGQSAGQFTGALSKNKSHLEDLMLIDRVEDFEVIRANDPEVAEIADRFARVHFDDGLPT
ncbi:hypothetical protein SLS63_010867 [Diaporthe eres]|uniref:Uncharacterized protein n=1 Tax=Diaporthe eres TaxID=83184 RepID=A0ABR1NVP7_DIAER